MRLLSDLESPSMQNEPWISVDPNDRDNIVVQSAETRVPQTNKGPRRATRSLVTVGP
jgi:hypothetical protein